MKPHHRIETIDNDHDYAAAHAIATGLLTEGDGEAGRELIRLAALMEVYEAKRHFLSVWGLAPANPANTPSIVSIQSIFRTKKEGKHDGHLHGDIPRN